MSILLYPNGQKVNVEFDEEQHTYVVQHWLGTEWSGFRPTHGITTPLAVVPKEFLKPWAAKVAVEALVDHLALNPAAADSITSGQFDIDKEAMDNNYRTDDGKPVMSSYKFKKLYPWFSESKTAYKRVSKAGTDIGSWLHSAIEVYYGSGRGTLPVITPDTQPAWDSFLMFDNFFKPEADIDGLEFMVYSMMFGYSGQGDFRGKMNGKTCIGDWKSTNRSYSNVDGISVEYFFQVGGLAQAEFERTGVWVDDLFIANFDKKGDEPRVIWASEFGASPKDCAIAYVSCFNTYHVQKEYDYKFSKRNV